MSHNPYGGTSGWTCHKCGCLIPHGTTHSCSTATAVRADPTWQILSALAAVTKELARIADALEKYPEPGP